MPKFKTELTQMDIMRASRKGSREAELSFENGFTSKHKVHDSLKSYKRKSKHKNNWEI